MKILVLGNGGREHALAHKFKQQGHQVFCFPGNGGTQEICLPSPELNLKDFAALSQFAASQKIDMTVVGPEQLLADGIADAFAAQGQPLFGPTQKAVQLESNKVASKKFMVNHHIPTARHVSCRSIQEAEKAVQDYFSKWNGVVIKCSGLTGGKGVLVCRSPQEAFKAIQTVMGDLRYGSAGKEIVVEEKLEGFELSILAFADGKKIIPMIPSQDHKRLYEGDSGPNTGGIGAYSPVPLAGPELLQQIREEIIEPTQAGLIKEGIEYKGVIYFGLMITASGPKVLEYNGRFGDPEAQAVLPLLQSDLAEIMRACIHGKLKEENIHWAKKASCCVVMVSGGYPEHFQTGYEIKGLDKLNKHPNCTAFHAGTSQDAKGRLVTSGGRVLGITGWGASLEEAVSAAYDGVNEIEFENSYYRRDIAYQALKNLEVKV